MIHVYKDKFYPIFENSKYNGKFEIGMRFGKLTVHSQYIFKDGKSRAYVTCTCECDPNRTVLYQCGNLLSGKCTQCKNCSHKNRSLQDNPNWKGSNVVPKAFMTRLSSSAVANNTGYDLDIPYVTKLIVQQNFVCPYTGKLIYPTQKSAALVRKKRSAGYVKGNVVWADAQVEKVKRFFETDDDLIAMCKQVAENFKHKESKNVKKS